MTKEEVFDLLVTAARGTLEYGALRGSLEVLGEMGIETGNVEDASRLNDECDRLRDEMLERATIAFNAYVDYMEGVRENGRPPGGTEVARTAWGNISVGEDSDVD